jgi:hypothetical protein
VPYNPHSFNSATARVSSDRRPESEKRHYDIDLVYKDDDGRTLTPKQAFRYLSYKFHGIDPSLNKTQKCVLRARERRRACTALSVIALAAAVCAL